jgi:hypothetical protein
MAGPLSALIIKKADEDKEGREEEVDEADDYADAKKDAFDEFASALDSGDKEQAMESLAAFVNLCKD